jgi:hypothetical protein
LIWVPTSSDGPNKILAGISTGEFSSENRIRQSIHIAILPAGLHPGANDHPYAAMQRWRSIMRELSAEARLHLYARSLFRRTETGVHTAALYSALAVIAAVVFGTLSVHPF